MAPNFQSSFIPKEPITREPFAKNKIGVVGFLAVSFFVLSIIGSIGMIVYKSILKSEIKSLQAQLASAEQGIDKKTIDEMLQFSKKLQLIKSIVDKHSVLSNFLVSLSSSTVNSVSFQTFEYSGENQKELIVNLEGKAPSYATVALQEDIFKKNKYWKIVDFSDLKLNDKGFVSFSVNLTIDPSISIYNPTGLDLKNNSSTLNNDKDLDISDIETLDDFGEIDAELGNL